MFAPVHRLIVALPVLFMSALAALAAECAVSADGKWLAVIGPPSRLTIFSTADGRVAHLFDAISREGRRTRFEGVYVDPKRRRFIAPLKDVPEYWLIATDPHAPPVYEGFVHSHEQGMIEALPSSSGLFARRRILLEGGTPLGGLSFSPDYREMRGLTPDGRWKVVVNLYVNREIARMPNTPREQIAPDRSDPCGGARRHRNAPPHPG